MRPLHHHGPSYYVRPVAVFDDGGWPVLDLRVYRPVRLLQVVEIRSETGMRRRHGAPECVIGIHLASAGGDALRMLLIFVLLNL